MRYTHLIGVWLLLLLSVVAHAQPNNPKNMAFYNSAWKRADSLLNQGLPKSALEVALEVRKRAQTEGNAAQEVKALIYKLTYSSQVQEDDIAKSIEEFRTEATNSKFPVKPLLHSMLADLYWQYYNQQRWQIAQRTQTSGDVKLEDIRTWDMRKIADEIQKEYLASLEKPQELQGFPIAIYDDILHKGMEKTRLLRPTLYEFLAHRAVDFLAHNELELPKPAYQFTFNNPDFLLPAKDFANLKVETKDVDSYKFHALKHLQELTRRAMTHPNKMVLADLDFKRITLMQASMNIPDKTNKFIETHRQYAKIHEGTEMESMFLWQVGELYFAQGKGFNPQGSPQFQSDLKTAYALAEDVIKRYDKTDGAQNCRDLQSRIKERELKITAKRVQVGNENFAVSLRYRNLPKVYWKVIKCSPKDWEKTVQKYSGRDKYYPEGDALRDIAGWKAVHEWTTDLPQEGDYQPHVTEEKINSLPVGDYIILCGSSPKFEYQGESISYALTTATNLSCVYRNTENAVEYRVLHRKTGKPMQGVEAEVYFQYYDYDSGRGGYKRKTVGNYKSDAEGYFQAPAHQNNKHYEPYYVNLKFGDDKLDGEDASYAYYYNREDLVQAIPPRAFTFADRAIYRPGQTLHFKSIVMQGNGEDNRLVPKFEVLVEMRDVNGQKVNELILTTNEFGSISGTFTLPTTGLTGQMYLNLYARSSVNDIDHTVAKGQTLKMLARLYNTNVDEIKRMNDLKEDNLREGQIVKVRQPTNNQSLGQHYFSVEEYKRPKFEVTFEPVKGTFRLNENIKVKGIAKAFSGASIDGAEVKYRVVREARFPRWWYYWYGGYPASPQMEITNGFSKTLPDGSFEVSFNALPDPNIAKENMPTFVYTVYADVTDINGETRSGSGNVAVSYQALALSASVPEEWDTKDAPQFTVKSTNLAGEPINAKGTFTIRKLKTPSRAYLPHTAGKPDKFIYSEADWHKVLPAHSYKDENNAYLWATEKEVFATSFNTEKPEKISPANFDKWESGQYAIEIKALDQYGTEVKEVYYLAYTEPKQRGVPVPTYLAYSLKEDVVEVGKTAVVKLASSEDVQVLYEIEHQSQIVKKEWVRLNNESKSFEIPIEEKHRGNLSVLVTMVKDNQAFTESMTITVPRTNKELDITFETFRNKLQPGQEEEWRIRIKGKNGDKVAAEMVATLYDASLDVFRANSWGFNIYNSYYATRAWNNGSTFNKEDFRLYTSGWNNYAGTASRSYDYLNWFNFNMYYFIHRYQFEDMEGDVVMRSAPAMALRKESAKKDRNRDDEKSAEEAPIASFDQVLADKPTEAKKEEAQKKPDAVKGGKKAEGGEDMSQVKVRTNFSETAFFYPHLSTDANGDVLVKFTVPEALTRWKMLGLAHTKTLQSAIATNALVTQKELMVVPNAPRFFRENDAIVFPSKITNLSDKEMTGTAQLTLTNPLDAQSLDAKLGNGTPQQPFKVPAGQSTVVFWSLKIPAGTQALTYRVVAKGGAFSDGEEMTLPVLTNSMLVTETMPLPIRGNQTKDFKMDKLIASAKSNTLRHEKVTLEFTSNPAWYAIQALPYMMEYPYECAEQVFSRYYANSLATHIVNSAPRIKQVFDSWSKETPESFLSALDKNQELKSIILEETPWLLNANNEGQRKRQVAVLFDLNRMSKELASALEKLEKKQVSSGAWTWFEGMPEDRYITQHIVTGLGHLDRLKVKSVRDDARSWRMVQKAIAYLDRQIDRDYEELKRLAKQGKIKLEDQHIGYFEVQYLYARTYFLDLPIEKRHQEAFDYYKGQAQKYWLSFNRYGQGMLALGLNRLKDTQTPAKVIKSLREKALSSEEMGTWWKDSYGYYWHEASIESHALMIELFDEVANDQKMIDDLKTWMLKQKQTQDWKTTKATAEACYALLLRGQNWLESEKLVEVTMGGQLVNPFSEANAGKVEAGTGYFKTSWKAKDVKPEMGNITVKKSDAGVAWGAVYWQYFEQLDKITPAATPVSIKKTLFLEKDSDTGKTLVPITEKTPIQVGDLVKVRIEIRVDRNLEYVHLKDMRASAFEPINVISSYKYQDGIGYYESTRDVATNFFIGYLHKGTYVFEYPLRATHEGDFSNGITTLQCMYAPEFASHSEGIRVSIKKK
ncbi:MAG: LysM peptidoglycan-binding domain-containing protein [Bacteroidetes bacterium]|nr:MAG: LysM peptidoglycan-binding domain-containing protein [Bacteroidota bacterium]